jgi:hypothetical protein
MRTLTVQEAVHDENAESLTQKEVEKIKNLLELSKIDMLYFRKSMEQDFQLLNNRTDPFKTAFVTKADLADAKADLMKWIFILFATGVILILFAIPLIR